MLIPVKRYLVLFGTTYENILREVSTKSSLAVFPTEDAAFPEVDQAYLTGLFKDRYTRVGYSERELLAVVSHNKPDILLSLGWRRIITKSIINSVNTCVNVHPAILPYYRGYHTEPYVIMNDERQHGITAHILTPELDAGPILLQKRFPINEFSTVKSIKRSVAALMPEFLHELFTLLENGDLQLSDNDLSKTKIVAPKRTPRDSELDPNVPLKDLYHSIRACDTEKYPAFFYYNGSKIFVKLWRDRTAKQPGDYEL